MQLASLSVACVKASRLNFEDVERFRESLRFRCVFGVQREFVETFLY